MQLCHVAECSSSSIDLEHVESPFLYDGGLKPTKSSTAFKWLDYRPSFTVPAFLFCGATLERHAAEAANSE